MARGIRPILFRMRYRERVGADGYRARGRDLTGRLSFSLNNAVVGQGPFVVPPQDANLLFKKIRLR